MYGSTWRSHPDSEPDRDNGRFLRCRENLLAAKSQSTAAACSFNPNLVTALIASSRLMFLTRGATYPGLPQEFAYPAALGDFVTAVLAFVALFFVTRDSSAARPLVWTFNIVGTVDLVDAITLATVHNAPPFMGPAYWIPAFWVPSLLVTHYIT